MKKLIASIILATVLILIVVSATVWKNNATNQKNWQFLIKDQIGAQSILNVGRNLTFDKNSIFFSDGKGLIHSLNKHSGQINWLRQIEDHSPFSITQDDNFIYVSSFDSSIYKIDKENGYIKWKFNIPDFFWPDTEVIFDENDESIFFADRGGNLYAINKESGKEAWKKEFEKIDNTKVFVEDSIHFGFLSQNEDHLIADHFPSKTIYTINKKTGDINSQKQSDLKINFEPKKNFLIFDNYELKIKNNVISQPLLELIDKNQNLVWSYQTEHRVNTGEIYQDENRIYYLSAHNTILESVNISRKNPNAKAFSKINFKLNENFAAHYPYQNSNPQVDAAFKPKSWMLKVGEKINYFKFVSKNFFSLFSFAYSFEEKNDFLEIAIHHQDNFYKNKFTEVKVAAEFENKENGKKIKVNGFYEDKNTWKIRAKLGKGTWKYQVKIQTPFWKKKVKGFVTPNKTEQTSIQIKENGFALGDSLFFPIGIQDVIKDSNKDGSPFNDMGYAKQTTPSSKAEEYEYTDLDKYLEIYRNEANMNIFRYGPDNWAPYIWRDLSNHKNFAMETKGSLKGDFILESAREKNYKIMMSIFAFYPPYTSKEAISKKENQKVLTQYLDYVIARYSAQVDIWELTNEALPSLEWQNFISNYLFKNDPYQHPITTNLEETRLENSDLLSIHHYPKTPENNRELVEQIEKINLEHNWSKAKIISEFGFANENYFAGSADLLRKTAWILTMQKIGLVTWNTGHGYFESETNGNIYVGPEERTYLKNLTDFLPKLSATAVSEQKIDEENNVMMYGLKDDSYEIFYLIKLDVLNEPKEFLLNAKFDGKIQFVDPRSGKVLEDDLIYKDQKAISLPTFADDIAIKVVFN